MKTRKRDLERAYDALATALATLATTVLTASRGGYATKEMGCQHVDGMVATVRQRGAELIELTENASGRCSAELIGMCENLIDRSATVLTEYTI